MVLTRQEKLPTILGNIENELCVIDWFIASLNVTEILMDAATLGELLTGLTDDTVGGVVSGTGAGALLALFPPPPPQLKVVTNAIIHKTISI